MLSGILILLVAASWIIIRLDLDRTIAARFYSPETGWYLRKAQPWISIYRWGVVPGIILAVTALAGWIYLRRKSSMLHLRKLMLVVVLTAVIGPGLLINGVMKTYWGRPRPMQITEFNGPWEYKHVHRPDLPGKGKSLPSGHAAMGFLLMTLFFFKPASKKIAYIGGLGGIFLGALVGLCRIVQGSHFLSDILWAGGVVALVSTALYYWVLRVPMIGSDQKHSAKSTKKVWLRRGVFGAAVGIVFAFFIVHRPIYATHVFHGDLPPEANRILIFTNEKMASLDIHYWEKPYLALRIEAAGTAWNSTTYGCMIKFYPVNDELRVLLSIQKKGYYTRIDQTMDLYLPKPAEGTVSVRLNDDDKGG